MSTLYILIATRAKIALRIIIASKTIIKDQDYKLHTQLQRNPISNSPTKQIINKPTKNTTKQQILLSQRSHLIRTQGKTLVPNLVQTLINLPKDPYNSPNIPKGIIVSLSLIKH